LSPAYDINPSNDCNELSLAINEADTTCDVAIALEARADYGLSKAEAGEIVARATAAVASWRSEAGKLRIPQSEQDLMAAAFVMMDRFDHSPFQVVRRRDLKLDETRRAAATYD
jgi:serine/threonine-protein kinase HipA